MTAIVIVIIITAVATILVFADQRDRGDTASSELWFGGDASLDNGGRGQLDGIAGIVQGVAGIVNLAEREVHAFAAASVQ